MEACQKAKVVEGMFKHLKEAFPRAETDIAKAKADLALEKEKREAEVVKVKKELTEAEKRAEDKAMGKYKASTNFAAKKD